MNWTKYPSVTNSVKPYFYTGTDCHHRASIVWNCCDGAYHVELDGQLLGLVLTHREGQALVTVTLNQNARENHGYT